MLEIKYGGDTLRKQRVTELSTIRMFRHLLIYWITWFPCTFQLDFIESGLKGDYSMCVKALQDSTKIKLDKLSSHTLKYARFLDKLQTYKYSPTASHWVHLPKSYFQTWSSWASHWIHSAALGFPSWSPHIHLHPVHLWMKGNSTSQLKLTL